MRTRLPLWLAFVLLLVGLPVAAQDGGRLSVLCTPQDDLCAAMTRAFRSQTGIPASYVRMSSGEALERLRADPHTPNFSIWWGGAAEALIAAADQGLLERYVSPNAGAIDPQYRQAFRQAWIGISVGALGFCSNVDSLAMLGLEPPATWADLLNPTLAGAVAFGHPATSGAGYTLLWTIVTLAADDLERTAMAAQGLSDTEIAAALADGAHLGAGYDLDSFPNAQAIDSAFTYLAALDSNEVTYTRSAATAGHLAADGDAAVAIIFSYDCVKLQLEGFHDFLVNTFPAEGTGYGLNGMAIIAHAPQPDAARVWYDWALTPEAQAIAQTVHGYQIPTNPAVDVSELSVSLDDVSLVRYDVEVAGIFRDELADRFAAEIAPHPAD